MLCDNKCQNHDDTRFVLGLFEAESVVWVRKWRLWDVTSRASCLAGADGAGLDQAPPAAAEGHALPGRQGAVVTLQPQRGCALCPGHSSLADTWYRMDGYVQATAVCSVTFKSHTFS